MFTDYHSHVLPELDDGAKSVSESLKMLESLANQGIERSVATPHFYAHREKDIENFLRKRLESFKKLSSEEIPVKEIKLGAEISIENGISEYDGIENLAIEGTRLILLEPPYNGYFKNLPDEVYNISCDYKLKPIIAHIHRYAGFYKKSEMEEILNLDAVFQINNEAFQNFSERHFVKFLIKEGYPVIFGSDCHNMTSRMPNFDLLLKKAGKLQYLIDKSNSIFDEYRI